MKRIIKYKCKENDNLIRFVQLEGDEDGEFWFALPTKKKSWIVIGAKDMARMLKKMGFRLYDKGVVG